MMTALKILLLIVVVIFALGCLTIAAIDDEE